MGNLAIKLGEALKYESLGTVEFLVDENKNFYFIEVNPRLQVEHPITEAIYGVDLVELQIRIAQGEKLPFKQKDIKFRGWAMEFRICVEDPLKNFQPVSGKIRRYSLPLGKGIEIHTFLQSNQVIFPYFDDLLAKLIIYARDRKTCLQRAKRAIGEFSIEGVPTLIPLFKVVLENKNFIEGKLSTSFIGDEKVVEKLREISPKEEIKIEEKELAKEIDKKEVAKILANLYQKFKKERKEIPKINKWKLAERMKFFEE